MVLVSALSPVLPLGVHPLPMESWLDCDWAHRFLPSLQPQVAAGTPPPPRRELLHPSFRVGQSGLLILLTISDDGFGQESSVVEELLIPTAHHIEFPAEAEGLIVDSSHHLWVLWFVHPPIIWPLIVREMGIHLLEMRQYSLHMAGGRGLLHLF